MEYTHVVSLVPSCWITSGMMSIFFSLMFSLGRPDVFPVGDLVVRKACKRLFGLSSGDHQHDTKVSNLPDAHELSQISTVS